MGGWLGASPKTLGLRHKFREILPETVSLSRRPAMTDQHVEVSKSFTISVQEFGGLKLAFLPAFQKLFHHSSEEYEKRASDGSVSNNGARLSGTGPAHPATSRSD
jgi:hypothetical protein